MKTKPEYMIKHKTELNIKTQNQNIRQNTNQNINKKIQTKKH